MSADKVFNALGGAQQSANPFPNPQQYQQPMQQQPVQQNTFGVDPITGLPL